MLNRNMDFENLKKHQKGFIQGIINDRLDRDELIEPIRKFYGNRYIDEYYVITPEIIISKQRGIGSSDEYFYEAFINGKRVIDTGAYTLDGAIILAIAAKNGDARAGQYAAKMMGLENV
ncbi:hypothetical protein AAGG74_15970 [Bacillus mexicanus]|uniref:hypothetical protein n=1 Tax=Bacillus mexicanus TaxID=2834415 RepID=UPI003D219CC1